MMVKKGRWLPAALLCLAVWPLNAAAQGGSLDRGLDVYVAGGMERAKRHRAFYDEQEKKLVAAVREAEAAGSRGPRLAERLVDLANLRLVYSRYADAEALFERALAILDRTPEPSNPTLIVTVLDGLGEMYRSQGRYAGAERLLKRSLAIQDEAAAVPPTELVVTLGTLARTYELQERYGPAERLLKRSLAIQEKTPNPPLLGMTLETLAQVYTRQGRYGEAEPLLKRALAMREKELGPDHPGVARQLNELATLYSAQGRYGDAERLLERALAIQEKALGPPPSQRAKEALVLANLAMTLNSWGLLYESQGRNTDAQPLFERASTIQAKDLAVVEASFGPQSIYLADGLETYAALLRKTGRDGAAEKALARADAIRAANK